jgi:putative SOS response-associated peptidase YedK
MCGRFTLKSKAKKVAEQFKAKVTEEFKPHYNIAPSARIPIVRVDPDNRERVLKRYYWGLVPYWARNPKIAAHTSNARADTVAEKASFKNAFKSRRLLVIMDGFYEWDRSVKPSQPYYFSMKDGEPFACAGLWEEWKVRWFEEADEEAPKEKKEYIELMKKYPLHLGGQEYKKGEVLESCTILTTDANPLMAKIHDRMPVILDSKNYDAWLDPQVEGSVLKGLLKPFPAEKMQCWPVSRLVNKVGENDSEKCVEKLKV